MSIQNEIERYLSDEGKNLRLITVIGKDGDVDLPGNCYLHLRQCNIGNLSTGTNCTVVIEQSNLNGNLSMLKGGALTMDRVIITGNIEVESVKMTQKKCSSTGSTTLKRNSILEAYENTRNTASPTLELLNSSSATLSDETIEGVVGVRVSGSSFLSLRNCSIRADETGIEAFDAAQIEMLGGVLYGESKYAYYADGNVQARLVNLREELIGDITAVYNDNYCTTQIINCPSISSDNFGVIADNYSKIEVTNFQTIKTKSVSVQSKHGSSVILSKGLGVESEEADTIYVLEAKFEARKVGYIKSMLSNCFYSKDSEITLREITEEIISFELRAIFSDGGDTYEVFRCPRLYANKEPAVEGKSNCKFRFKEVDLIFSELGDGIILDNDCTVEAINVAEIWGKEGDGIHCENRAVINLLQVGKIKAGGFAGIKVGDDSHIRGLDVESVRAWDGEAIKMGSNCSLDFQRFTLIESVANGKAIEATSSKVVLKSGGEVLSQIKDAIIIDGSGGSLYARDITKIFGVEGDGVRVSGGIIEIVSVDRVEGGGKGINFAAGTRGTVNNVTKVLGGEGGVKADEGALASFQNVDEVEGLGQPGFILDGQSSVDVIGPIAIIGAPDSIKVSDGSKFTGTGCNCANIVSVDTSSTLILSNSTLDDELTASSSSVTTREVSVAKKISLSGSSANLESTSTGEELEASSSSITAKKLDITKECILTSSSAILLESSALKYVPTSTSLYLGGCSGMVDYVSGVTIDSTKGGSLITMANTTEMLDAVSFETRFL